MKTILIAGATGYLGQYVVKAFKRSGFRVRALARNPEKLDHLCDFIDEVVEGEITNFDSLTGVCDDVDLVFSAVGITRQKDGLSYLDVDYQGNKNLLDLAQIAGVEKFVYVSVLQAENLTELKMVQAKQKFVTALQQSGLDYTVIYPNGYFSDMVEFLEMAKAGRGYVFGQGTYKMNPIHGADLAQVCVEAATTAEHDIRVGGPDVLTHRQILALAFEAVGRQPKITSIPLWVRNAGLTLLRTFTSVKTYGPLEFFLTVLAMDMVAKPYGHHHLKDFFAEKAAAL
ncbi:MAG TPA: SDR family oxidoreductase [Anaerolineae bacterium]|nr:SDR family oxidoreductase [Anaerolineae bacterium]HMR66063.1 SDR family oxidoreductase [Anaerolineae bacterium]